MCSQINTNLTFGGKLSLNHIYYKNTMKTPTLFMEFKPRQ